MATTRTVPLLLVLSLVAAACSGDDATAVETTRTPAGTTPTTGPPRPVPIDHRDSPADCRSAFAEGPVACGPGADITSVSVDRTGPIVLTIELSEPPQYDDAFQWLAEFQISSLACGLTNTVPIEGRYVTTPDLGSYGFNVITNESAPDGTCEGSLEGTTATIIFNIQPPPGPWTVAGGTQYVEIENQDDDGSSDDVVIDVSGE